MNLIKRVVREALDDNITGEAAKAAYYFFLSLFPLILVLFALTGFVGGERAFDWIMAQLRASLPPDAAEGLRSAVAEVTLQQRPGVLGVGLLLTLWAASNVFAALGDGLNAMFDVRRRANWFRRRGKALLLLLLGAVLLVGGAVAILAGPELGRAVGLEGVAEILRLPLAFVLLTALIWLALYILPDQDQSRVKKEALIGALVGAVTWLAATSAFRFYVVNFGNYGATYGSVGAVVVLMLWLFVTALSILLAGEVANVLASGKKQVDAGSGRTAAREEPRAARKAAGDDARGPGRRVA